MNRACGSDVYIHPWAEVEEGVSLGVGTTVWRFAHIMRGARLGKHCMVGQGVFIGRNVHIGNYVRIQNGAQIYEGAHIADEVFIGPGVIITNDRYPRIARLRRCPFQPVATWIEHGASIGAGSIIVCGVRIGAYALVGAGSVVLEDVPPHALVAGNPAVHIGWVSHAGQPLSFDEEGYAICPVTQRRYRYLIEAHRVICLTD